MIKRTSVKKNLDDDINDIIKEFHNTIFKVLKICKKIEPNNVELEWLHNKLSLARDIDPLMIINKCSEKIWAHREHIITENEDFFLNNKYTEYIKEDENKSFMYSLVDLLKDKYKVVSTSEKKVLWSLIKSMLASIVKYKKTQGNFI